VQNSSNWDVFQWQVVTWLDISRWALLYWITLSQVVWGNDVALLTICVVQKCNTCGAVRVVFNVSDLRWDAVFIVTTEINYAVLALVSTTDVAGSDASS
jgi:hypothetical protein